MSDAEEFTLSYWIKDANGEWERVVKSIKASTTEAIAMANKEVFGGAWDVQLEKGANVPLPYEPTKKMRKKKTDSWKPRRYG